MPDCVMFSSLPPAPPLQCLQISSLCTLTKKHGDGVVIVPSGKLLFAFAGQSVLMQLSLHPAHPLRTHVSQNPVHSQWHDQHLQSVVKALVAVPVKSCLCTGMAAALLNQSGTLPPALDPADSECVCHCIQCTFHCDTSLLTACTLCIDLLPAAVEQNSAVDQKSALLCPSTQQEAERNSLFSVGAILAAQDQAAAMSLNLSACSCLGQYTHILL